MNRPTSPPISPPNRTKSGWGAGCVETNKSKQRQEQYHRYLEQYGKDLDAN